MLSRLISMTPEITDYTEGAVNRGLIAAVADIIQETDQLIYRGLRDGINTGVYKSFNFARKPPAFASGNELFTIPGVLVSPLPVPVGTQVQPRGSSVIYSTTAPGTIPAGPGPNSVLIPVIASVAGTVGNTGANTITQIVGSLGATATATNPAPFINGTDQESDSGRFQRFQDFIAGLSKGTQFAIRQIAEQQYITDVNGNITEQVQQALVIEPWKNNGFIGLVNTYIDNGSGTASGVLVAQTLKAIAGFIDGFGITHTGFISAGVRPFVGPVIPARLDITATATLPPGGDPTVLLPNAISAITSYIQSLNAGDETILAQIEAAAINAGLLDFIFVQMVLSGIKIPINENIIPLFNNRIVAGAIAVTA